MNEKACKVLAAQIRLETLKVIHSRGFGHVGGSMDLADLMAVLYGEVMRFDPKNPRWEDRDWLVLSKGHAGPVAYATFGLMGFYPMEEAYTLNHPHTRFPSHTDRKLTPGVDLTTGSLGQGASSAAGAALGNRIDGRDSRVFCVIGDGEADEGEVWEAFHFAYAHKLDNLVYFIDNNGYTRSRVGHPGPRGSGEEGRGLRPVHPGDRRPRREGHLRRHSERPCQEGRSQLHRAEHQQGQGGNLRRAEARPLLPAQRGAVGRGPGRRGKGPGRRQERLRRVSAMNVKLIGKHEKDSRACRDGLALALNEMMAQDRSICYVDCGPDGLHLHQDAAEKTTPTGL